MPIYEFDCPECAIILEEFHKMGECPDEIKCYKCGKPAVKIVSKAVVHNKPVTGEELKDKYSLNEAPENQDPWGWKHTGKVPKSSKWNQKKMRYEDSKKTFRMGE